MLYPDLIDLPMEVLGGYCPAIPPSDLSPGAATIAQDVEFPQGAVRTRRGLQNVYTVGSPIPSNAAINGLRSYLTPTLDKRLMVWDSLGNLFKENPQGTLNLINSRGYKSLFYRSDTVFGREYQGFFDGSGGFDIPRQYDDTNWDRVSQVGPGASPQVSDETLAYSLVAGPAGAISTISNIVAAPNGLTQSGLLVTLKSFNANTFLYSQVGDSILVAGAGVAGYNATWVITRIVDPQTVQFIANVAGLAASGGGTVSLNLAFFGPTDVSALTQMSIGQPFTVGGVGVGGYNGNWTVRAFVGVQVIAVIASFGLAASGGGTITLGGNIAAGRHQVSVAFITRQGFITQAAIPTFWIASGNKRAALAGIPIGPANVIARLLLFTPVITAPALTGSFYSLPNGSTQIGDSAVMLLANNTATTMTVDFTDAVLIAGFQANYLFTQLELGESAFTIGYNSRLVWLGERNKAQNLVNMTFDGGWSVGGGTSGADLPLGWTAIAGTPGQGGSRSSAIADWGESYAITGNGIDAVRGQISQTAFKDYLGVPIIQINTGYNVRVRVRSNGGAGRGRLRVGLSSATSPGIFPSIGACTWTDLSSTVFREFSVLLTAAQAQIPADTLLQVFVDNQPLGTETWYVDSIEVYPVTAPFNYSTARLSHAFNPESYDGTTGQIQIRPGDGQQLRAGFPLRNNLYLAKDHYLCYVADDGINEPASWSVNEVSGTIGICGPNAVDWTEEWAVFAERSGLYICWGSDPVKLTSEIQTDASAGFPLYGQGGFGSNLYGGRRISWSDINWSAAHTIWVRIDKANNMILVGAPVSGATTPTVVFMLDYQWLEGADDIANSPMVIFSRSNGKMISHGAGRRWAMWNIQANSMTFAERVDGNVEPFFGNGGGFGKIYRLADPWVQASDDGNALQSIYQTHGIPAHMDEQQYGLGAHRKLFGYLKFRTTGAGLLLLAISTALRTTLLRSYALAFSPAGDGERPVNIHGERFFITLRTNAVGHWFQLEKLIPCLKKDSTIVVRGVSA